MKKRHVIIGASAAGIGVLSKLRSLAPEDEITCIAAQEEMPFNTCLLANFLATGIQPGTLYTRPESFFTKNNIDLHLKTRICRINKKERYVQDTNNKKYYFDTLFVGIGTTPIVVHSDFKAQSGYFKFHSLYDALAIDTFLRERFPKTAIVIGAGLSGVECADALTERGIHVTVIDGSSHPLSTLLPKKAGDMLDIMMKKKGTTFYKELRVERVLVEPFTGRTQGVLLTSGFEIYADMVVCAVGCTSNIDLGLQVVTHLSLMGIPVNRNMQTATPGIYAGGDAATVPTPLYPHSSPFAPTAVRSCTWPDAVQQGMIAGQNMAGREVAYAGAVVITSSHFYGTEIVSTGKLEVHDRKAHIITHQGENWYHTFTISNTGQLLAFAMLGNIRNVGVYRKLLASQEQFDTAVLDPLAHIAPVSK